MTPLRICVDARLVSGTAGGLEPMIAGLARGLSDLTDGDEEYLFLAYPGSRAWLQPHLSGKSRLLDAPVPLQQTLKRWISDISPVIRRDFWAKIGSMAGWRRPGRAELSDGTIESAGVDIMHFTRQDAFATSIPFIYHPHDLLHVHYPELVGEKEFEYREFTYRYFCERASMVAVTASWGRRDLIDHFELEPDRVAVVPWAPAVWTASNPSPKSVEEMRVMYSLPTNFALYPAQTWPHKNHKRLLDAIKLLRDEKGQEIHLVLPGRFNEYQESIGHHVDQIGLSELVHFLGHVTNEQLRCLYSLARCVIIPTKFEAASGPLWEAFATGVPAACSTVTALPRQARNAALLFDPDDSIEMADAIYRLWTDEQLRTKLVRRGTDNVSRFSWDRTARHFRAHYRQLASRPLTDEDSHYLEQRALL